MTRPASRPRYLSTDLSLNYQTMMDSLSKNNCTKDPPFKFDPLLPAGVNDLNRSMLMRSSGTKLRDLENIGSNIKHSKHQQKNGTGVHKTEMNHQLLGEARNNGELVFIGKNASANGRQLRRSKSEPTYFPPIKEGTRSPGSIKYPSSGARDYMPRVHGTSKTGRKTQEGMKKNVFHHPSSTMTHNLPTLSRLPREKVMYQSGDFVRSNPRHVRRPNVNMQLGRQPPRILRNSWEDTSRSEAARDDSQKVELKKDEVQQLTLRLRDMNLAFPRRRKMENLRQWHDCQFKNHLEHWKRPGSDREKKEEALKLLAHYLEKESASRTESGILNIVKGDQNIQDGDINIKMHRPVTVAEENSDNDKCKITDDSEQDVQNCLESGETNSAPRNNWHKFEHIRIEESIKNDKIQCERESSKSSDDPLPLTHRKINEEMTEEHVVYTDPDQYILDNNLLTPGKRARICDWLSSNDITLDEVFSSESSDMSQHSSLDESEIDLDYEIW